MNLVNNLNNNFKKLKDMKSYEIIFVALMVLYLLSNVSTPYSLAPYVNNIYMNMSLIAIVVLLFLYTNPLIAIFFGVVALVFLQRSKKVDHEVMAPSVANKSQKMQNLNQHLKSTSLEEEIVGQIQKQPDNIINPETYNAVMCDSHNASNF